MAAGRSREAALPVPNLGGLPVIRASSHFGIYMRAAKRYTLRRNAPKWTADEELQANC